MRSRPHRALFRLPEILLQARHRARCQAARCGSASRCNPASEAVASRVSPGLHGTTFGGGPLIAPPPSNFSASSKRKAARQHPRPRRRAPRRPRQARQQMDCHRWRVRREDQAFAADFADEIEFGGELGEAFAELGAAGADVGEQLFAFDDAEKFEGGGANQRPPPNVVPCRPGETREATASEARIAPRGRPAASGLATSTMSAWRRISGKRNSARCAETALNSSAISRAPCCERESERDSRRLR